MLADVRHLEQVGIHPRLGACPPEGTFVHQGRARGYYNTSQSLSADIILNEGLTWVGAHIGIVASYCHVFEHGSKCGYCFHVNHGCDIGTAMADINANSWGTPGWGQLYWFQQVISFTLHSQEWVIWHWFDPPGCNVEFLDYTHLCKKAQVFGIYFTK